MAALQAVKLAERARELGWDAMDAILFVLRTRCQWNAFDATGICSCSSAYRRFREWLEAVCLKSSGAGGCWSTIGSRASTGAGCRWMAR